MTIYEFCDSVHEEIITSNVSKNDVISALNEHASEKAFHIFISGLRRPYLIFYFPLVPNLPSALAIAQELKSNKMCYDFAETFAIIKNIRNHLLTYKLLNHTI